ncbi:hypothetical protein D0T84_08410 [Dysgonomonas sp. 521]|nr:hypothetical protein [Dysgonomonas sp. 521]
MSRQTIDPAYQASAAKPMVGRTAERGAMLFCLLWELRPKVRQAICDCAQHNKLKNIKAERNEVNKNPIYNWSTNPHD